MKKIILLVSFLIIACGGGASDGTPDCATVTWESMVTEWQQREALVPEVVLDDYESTGDLFKDLRNLVAQFDQWKYVPEPEGQDYWKTSYEALTEFAGDCEDVAAAILYIIKGANLPFDIDVRISNRVYGEGVSHPIVIVYHGLDVYEIDSNFVRNWETGDAVNIEYDESLIF